MLNSNEEPNSETRLAGVNNSPARGLRPTTWRAWLILLAWRTHMRRVSAIFAGIAALGTVFGGLAGYWTIYRAANDWIKDEQSTARPSRLSIAVLPFDNISGDPSQEYLSIALTENLATNLAVSMPMVTLISGHPTNDQENPGGRRKRFGGKQPARYVLSGSVLRTRGGIQVNARLIDAMGGEQLWADRFEGEASDTVSVQDQVAARIATSLQFTLPAIYVRSAKRQNTNDVVDVMLRGKVALDDERQQGSNPFIQAERYYREAAALDPHNSEALAGLALVLSENLFNGRLLPPGIRAEQHKEIAKRQEAEELVEKATRIIPAASGARLARALLHLHEQRFELARLELEQARSINPNDYVGLHYLALTYVYLGLPEQALPVFSDIHLKTSGRVPAYHLVLLDWGRCLLLLARWNDAIAKLREAYAIRTSAMTSGALAIAYIQIGDSAKAQFHFKLWQDWYAISSKPTMKSLNASQREISSVSDYLTLVNTTAFDGYRKLGVPEE